MEALFDWLTGTDSQSLRQGMVVDVRILPSKRHVEPAYVMVAIQDTEISGKCPSRCLPDGVDERAPYEVLKEGSVLPAVITDIDKDRFVCAVSLYERDVADAPTRYVEDAHFWPFPHDAFLDKKAVLETDAMDIDGAGTVKAPTGPRFTRAVVHPMFKNVTGDEARKMLEGPLSRRFCSPPHCYRQRARRGHHSAIVERPGAPQGDCQILRRPLFRP